MTAQQDWEYQITESEIQQWETVTKMSPVCQELRARIRSRGPIRSPTAKEYIITESQIDKFLDYVEDDTNHDESKYKNARGLAYKIRIRALPHNPEPHPTPLCNSRCKLYLVGRGCIHQLEYESTGICRESIRAETRAATIAEVLASAGSKCPDTCIYKRNAEEHDDQVREKVLDELIRRIDTATEPDGSVGELFHISVLHCIIDSLRSEVKKP